MTDLTNTHARFQTTNWTDVFQSLTPDTASGGPGAQTLQASREKLARSYYPPVYAYLRSRGNSRDQACEIASDFFADVVYTRELLERADRTRGRLRSLILAALTNYIVDWHRRPRNHAAGMSVLVDLKDLETCDSTIVNSDAPSEGFDVGWAVAVFNEALSLCEEHFKGKPGYWDIFESRVLVPSLGLAAPVDRERLAAKYGFSGVAVVSAKQQVVVDRLRAIMRDIVRATAADDAEAEREYETICSLLRQRSR